MKKIAVWKVIVLSIITLGIYTIVWFARRRDELVMHYDAKIPHWLWLVTPILLALTAFLPLLILAGALSFVINDPLLVMSLGTSILVLVPLLISIWWISRFGAAVAQLTKGQVPTVWTVLLYIFWGFMIAAIHQHYFNRVTVKKMPSNTDTGPSQKFVTLSVIAIAISLLTSVSSFMSLPADYNKAQQQFQGMMSDSEATEFKKLTEEYQTCVSALDADYPKLTEENEKAYNTAYDQCDAIRVEIENF